VNVSCPRGVSFCYLCFSPVPHVQFLSFVIRSPSSNRMKCWNMEIKPASQSLLLWWNFSFSCCKCAVACAAGDFTIRLMRKSVMSHIIYLYIGTQQCCQFWISVCTTPSEASRMNGRSSLPEPDESCHTFRQYFRVKCFCVVLPSASSSCELSLLQAFQHRCCTHLLPS
jgi:hypothetical protein